MSAPRAADSSEWSFGSNSPSPWTAPPGHGRRRVVTGPELVLRQVAAARQPHALLRVLLLAGALGHLRVRPVGEPVEDRLPLGGQLAQAGVQLAALLAQLLALPARGLGVGPAEAGQLLLLRVEAVDLLLQGAALAVDVEEAVHVGPRGVDPAQGDGAAHGVGFGAQSAYVDHRGLRSEGGQRKTPMHGTMATSRDQPPAMAGRKWTSLSGPTFSSRPSSPVTPSTVTAMPRARASPSAS